MMQDSTIRMLFFSNSSECCCPDKVIYLLVIVFRRTVIRKEYRGFKKSHDFIPFTVPSASNRVSDVLYGAMNSLIELFSCAASGKHERPDPPTIPA